MAGSQTRDAGPIAVSPSALRRLMESSAAIAENCKRLAGTLQKGSASQGKILDALNENSKLRNALRTTRKNAKATRTISERLRQPRTISEAESPNPAPQLVLIKGKAERNVSSSPQPSIEAALSITAHEINNPLDSISSLLHLLDKEASISAPGHHYVELIQGEVARIGEIVRVALGKHQDRAMAEGVDLGELIDNVLDLYRLRFQSRSINIAREYKSRSRIPVHPRQMREVFANLFLNAVDAMGNGGRLRIRISEATQWRHAPRRGIRITVADNGHGIQRRHAKRIFERFFTTKGERGSGIGLSVVHDIVRNHGGVVRFRSSARKGNSGTVFSMFLPTDTSLDRRNSKVA